MEHWLKIQYHFWIQGTLDFEFLGTVKILLQVLNLSLFCHRNINKNVFMQQLLNTFVDHTYKYMFYSNSNSKVFIVSFVKVYLQ